MKRKILFIITLVVIGALTLLCVLRWKVWFHNKPEPSYTVYSKIAHIQLSFGEDFSERYVTWQSVPLTDSANTIYQYGVIWMPVNQYFTNSVNASASVPSVVDSEFQSDTASLHNSFFVPAKYQYIKTQGGEAGYFYAKAPLKPGRWKYSIVANDTMSQWYETYVPKNDSLAFLVLADIQDKKYSGTDTLVESIIAHHNINGIFQLGDLIERPHQYYWDRYFDDFKNISPIIPTLAVLGNHDYVKGINKHPDARFFYVFPSYLINDSIPEVGNIFIKLPNVSFYLMDTNQPLCRLYKQKQWLKTLNSENTNTIILMHHPFKSAISWFRNLRMMLCLGNVFDNIDAELILAGHEHTFDIKEINDNCTQIITNFSAKNYNDDVQGRYYIILNLNSETVKAEVYNEKHVLKQIFEF